MKKKGFTLIEVIVVVSIIGVLAAILVPAMMGYIRKAKKTATVANGKELWNICYSLVCDNDACAKSFYTKLGRWTVFEGRADGRVEKMTQNYGGTGYLIPAIYQGGSSVLKTKVKQEGNYLFAVVARVDGAAHATGGNRSDPLQVTRTFNVWDYSDSNYKTFVDELTKRMEDDPKIKGTDKFPLKMPCTDRDDGGDLDVVRWLLCYRVNEKEHIEIWAGDGFKAENGPVYRVYPQPCDWYEVS